METIRMNVHSQEDMETMARLMSEALESPEGMRALAAAIAEPIEQEIKRKEISSLLLTKHTHDVLRTQQILTGKCHDRIHDPTAITPQDIRPIRDSQRLTENGGHGEPIRQTANRCRKESMMKQSRQESATQTKCTEKPCRTDT